MVMNGNGLIFWYDKVGIKIKKSPVVPGFFYKLITN